MNEIQETNAINRQNMDDVIAMIRKDENLATRISVRHYANGTHAAIDISPNDYERQHYYQVRTLNLCAIPAFNHNLIHSLKIEFEDICELENWLKVLSKSV